MHVKKPVQDSALDAEERVNLLALVDIVEKQADLDVDAGETAHRHAVLIARKLVEDSVHLDAKMDV